MWALAYFAISIEVSLTVVLAPLLLNIFLLGGLGLIA